MQYVYNKTDNAIICKLSDCIDIERYFKYFPEGFLEDKDILKTNENIANYKEYKIIDNEFVRMSDLEIEEVRWYKRILTEEERQLEKLKPSQEEIQKAEQTIEILTLIQEVI